MDKLKWMKVGPGDRWPESGRFVVKWENGGERLINGEKGKEIWTSSTLSIAGPIDIAEPDPKLELPEGWVRLIKAAEEEEDNERR